MIDWLTMEYMLTIHRKNIQQRNWERVLALLQKAEYIILRAEKGSPELTTNLVDYDDVPIYDIKCSYCTQATEDYIVFGSSFGE